MRVTAGRVLDGVAGRATEVLCELEEGDPVDWQAGVAAWFLHCPGQALWDHYRLTVVHLRPVDGGRAPIVHLPGVTHEVMVLALDPRSKPAPTDERWSMLRPVNVCEQLELPSDDAARGLAADCARAVVDGVLPAEPLLAGAVEPWRSALLRTAAHYRGEPHAP